MDALPDALEDPPPEECLQVTPTEVRRDIYGLSTNSGAGNSSWTNMAIVCIGDDRRDRAYDENITQPNATHIEARCYLPDSKETRLEDLATMLV